jgi:DNA-directed RNA polymerase specialized sigma24 family protein
VVQETFLRAPKPPPFRPQPGSIGTWLYQIAELCRHLRRKPANYSWCARPEDTDLLTSGLGQKYCSARWYRHILWKQSKT